MQIVEELLASQHNMTEVKSEIGASQVLTLGSPLQSISIGIQIAPSMRNAYTHVKPKMGTKGEQL